jgi:hypothetical protein
VSRSANGSPRETLGQSYGELVRLVCCRGVGLLGFIVPLLHCLTHPKVQGISGAIEQTA